MSRHHAVLSQGSKSLIQITQVWQRLAEETKGLGRAQREMVPGAARIAVLVNPANSFCN